VRIVTLRGGACLVLAIAKIADDCQKSPKLKNGEFTAEAREDRYVPIREMLRGGETHGWSGANRSNQTILMRGKAKT
jgi:hypothetical protein